MMCCAVTDPEHRSHRPQQAHDEVQASEAPSSKLTMGWVIIRLTLGGILAAAAARRAPDWQAASVAPQSSCLLGPWVDRKQAVSD